MLAVSNYARPPILCFPKYKLFYSLRVSLFWFSKKVKKWSGSGIPGWKEWRVLSVALCSCTQEPGSLEAPTVSLREFVAVKANVYVFFFPTLFKQFLNLAFLN